MVKENDFYCYKDILDIHLSNIDFLFYINDLFEGF